MYRAVDKFRKGSEKELYVDVGLCDVRDYEKSYKYCNDRHLNESAPTENRINEQGKRVIELTGGFKRVTDMIAEEDAAYAPLIIGMEEV